MPAGTPADRAAWPWPNARFFVATALLACIGASFPGTPALAADADGDLIQDTADNCVLVANTSQLDADNDGNGNACDGDLDNSGLVTSADYIIMKSVLGDTSASSSTAAVADLDGSGTVNTLDLLRLRVMMGSAPGPSGLGATGGESGSGFAFISWLPPTQRTDGSALTNLAGYQIRYGTRPGNMNQTIWLDDAGLTSYLVQGLAPGNWYFVMVAIDSDGQVSALSAVRYKTVS
jgi:hypothetical protein